MATQSIFSNVRIREKKMAKSFIKNLEIAKEKKEPVVAMSQRCNKIKKGNITKMWE